MKVLVIGGGIGGLATALCLHQKGIGCTIYEQSDGVRELGVGINTLPHAIKELAELGLLDALDRNAVRTYELFYTNRFGQTIWHELRGTDAGYEMPQFSIHRGRLQGVLYEAVRERLGDDAIRTGHRLVAFEQDDDGVTAHFVDRAGKPLAAAHGDALIACDGIHSAVRATLFPDEGPPRWNGLMLWRGATDWPQYLTGRSMYVAGGMNAKLVVYPIGAGSRPGMKLTNWAVVARIGDGSVPPPRKEDWSRPGRREELMPHVQRFALPHVDAIGLIEATPQFYEYPMCDRDPLSHWSQGRVTLLGDAAHPMYPVGSNGASQAVLDARALARLLSQTGDVAAALKAYEAERLPPTAEIVRLNRSGGPEGVIDAVEQLAPDGFDDIENVLSHAEREAIVRGYAKTAGFAREQVNKPRRGGKAAGRKAAGPKTAKKSAKKASEEA